MTARMTPTRSSSPAGSAGTRPRPRIPATIPPPEVRPAPDLGPPAEVGPDHDLGPADRNDPTIGPTASPPPGSARSPFEPRAGEADVVSPRAVTGPRPAERRAWRAARRRRRQLAVGCALLVALCLGITILIVVMAGNRTPGPQVLTAAPAASAASMSLAAAPASLTSSPDRAGGHG